MDEKIIGLLKERQISVTIQRIKILKYLMEYKTHPCVEDIFLFLKNTMQDVSRATVYNNLMVFKDSGLVQEIMIEKDRGRYDGDTTPHGHFYCRECGAVFDISCHFDAQEENYSVDQYQVYLYGSCHSCEQNKKADAS